jgi:hypothetical protein
LPFYQHVPRCSASDAKAARAEKLPIHLRYVPMSRISGVNTSAFPHPFMACTEANLSVVSPFPNVTKSLTLDMNGFILSEIKISLFTCVNISYYLNIFKVSHMILKNPIHVI